MTKTLVDWVFWGDFYILPSYIEIKISQYKDPYYKPISIMECHTLPETNSSPLKIGHPKRKLVFQPSIFRCYVSFREGKGFEHCSLLGGFRDFCQADRLLELSQVGLNLGDAAWRKNTGRQTAFETRKQESRAKKTGGKIWQDVLLLVFV